MQIAMLAADFSPDEADDLRRSMAAWKRRGGVHKFHDLLVQRMQAKGYSAEYAEGIFSQIVGFGEYGFPESHAASFAQLVYVSAWLKRHEPEAFLAALLNAQPMGFYSPAQLTQDARRHGVRILPVDVCDSDWECQLRADPGQARPAVRIGLNQVSGLGQAWAERIVQARRTGSPSFADVRDLALRTGLDQRALNLVADAGALQGLAGHRHLAAWTAAAAVASGGLLREAPILDDDTPALPAPSEGQDIVADYRRLGFTLGRHPLALLRPQLAKLRFAQAEQLAGCPDGRLARACGLVTMRQRPQTAQGVIFVTIEDETGLVNVIVRPELATRQRRELLHAPLLAVIGTWQNIQGVRHLLAGRLEDHSHLLGVLNTASRNFH